MNRFIALLCVAAFLTAAAPQQIAPLDATEIQFSYEKLRTDFYRKTDAQAIVNGARTEIGKQLRLAGVGASLPQIFAAQSSLATARAVGHEVDVATRLAHGKISSHMLAYAAIAGMLNSVHDRYTTFLTPKEYAELNQGLDGGSFAGTGIVIEQNDTTKYIDVSNVVPDGPADKAGVQEGDIISAID